MMAVSIKKKELSKWLWAVVTCLMGLALIGSAGLTQSVKCTIDPEELHWVVNAPGYTDPVIVAITRVGNADNAIWYRLTDLVNDDTGYVLPQGSVEVYNGYSGNWQAYTKWSDHITFLASKESHNEVGIRLTPLAWGPAGTYQGHLDSPNSGTKIPITVEILRQAVLTVEPAKVSITAAYGPGTYRTNEMITIRVEANHPHWTVNVSTKGLTYIGEPKAGVTAVPPRIDPEELQLKLAGDSGPGYSLARPVVFQGEGYPGKTWTMWIECTLGWEHYAGDYEGVIDVILTQY